MHFHCIGKQEGINVWGTQVQCPSCLCCFLNFDSCFENKVCLNRGEQLTRYETNLSCTSINSQRWIEKAENRDTGSEEGGWMELIGVENSNSG